jgi:hypothetical protein
LTVSILTAALLCLSGCAAPLREFYADSYFPEDRIYENKTIGFSLRLRGEWQIATDPSRLTRPLKELARTLQSRGAELLFVGATAEGAHGTRGIAANLNLDPRAYAQRVKSLNEDGIGGDSGFIDFLAGDQAMVKWVYDKDGFRFAEFFFNVDTYDVRIAFWTKPELFGNFLPVYEEIIATVGFRERL